MRSQETLPEGGNNASTTSLSFLIAWQALRARGPPPGSPTGPSAFRHVCLTGHCAGTQQT
eukprot:128442-Lingulodinium_polyedra.AAC.1